MTLMNVLVTGGAGYIGSVIAARLLAAGHAVTVYDDLSRGHRAAVPAGATLVTADIRDADSLAAALQRGGCEAIVHMAALAEVAESVAFPERYRDVNVERHPGGRSTRRCARRVTPRVLVDGGGLRRARAHPHRRGRAARAGQSLRREQACRRARCWARRPPPAAAASPPWRCATSTPPAPTARAARITLPRATSCRWRSRAVRDGTALKVFGDDYPTPDGTCVRDYVHVSDLAAAHVAALERLPQAAGAYNLGTGGGSSVLEVSRAVAAATAREPVVEHAPRRRRRPSRARGLERPRPARCSAGDRGGGSTTSSPTPGRGCATIRAATTTRGDAAE